MAQGIKLPAILKGVLNTQLPKLMAYFEENLGAIDGPKPMLFASYSNKPGSSVQGGTLPGQIFMHWDFDDLDTRIKSQSYVHQTLWFFAHEAAHFFQVSKAGNVLFGEPDQSWIHEGGADWLAYKALQHLYPDIQDYADGKIAEYKQQCREGLKQQPLADSAQNGNFRLYYSCGFFIHQALETQISIHSGQQQTIFDLWHTFGNKVDESTSQNQSSTRMTGQFWRAVSDLLPGEAYERIKLAVNTEQNSSLAFHDVFLTDAE